MISEVEVLDLYAVGYFCVITKLRGGGIYVGPQVGTGPVLELGPIFRPVLELGRGRPHTGTPCLKLIWCQFGDKY